MNSISLEKNQVAMKEISKFLKRKQISILTFQSNLRIKLKANFKDGLQESEEVHRVGRTLVLHLVNLGSIPVIPNGLPNSARSYPKYHPRYDTLPPLPQKMVSNFLIVCDLSCYGVLQKLVLYSHYLSYVLSRPLTF